MKKYYTPDIKLEALSQSDVIMLSGDIVLQDGEALVGVSSNWFAMGMDIE